MKAIYHINRWRPRQDGHHFPDENIWISIKVSLKFVPKGLINNIPSRTGSDNGLASVRQQAIVWTNDG